MAMWAFVLGIMLIQGSEGMRDIDGTARSAMGALQRDMKMLGDITICTGLKRYIACIEGSNLAITKAFWGRISDKVCPSDDGDPVTDCDGSEDTLPLVKGYCEGKRECKLEARHTLLQKNGTHHCPGVNKYLVVNYTCIPESKSVALCDSAETTLTCEAGWVIDIADIFWGRRSHAKYCGAEEGMECDSSDSAAKYIRSNCDGHRRCVVRADPALLDNAHSPCTTILKYLMINYVCKPPEKGNVFTNVKNDDEANAVEAGTGGFGDSPTAQEIGKMFGHVQPAIQPRPHSPAVTVTTNPRVQTPNNAIQVNAVQRDIQPHKTTTKTVITTNNNNKGKSISDELGSLLLEGSNESIRNEIMPEYEKATSKLEELSKAQRAKYSPQQQQQRKNEISDHNEALLKKQVTTDVSASTKDLIPQSKEDHEYELSEPSTVRSILARAKEVLKTLDSDAASEKPESPFLEKREDISRKNFTDIEAETEKTIASVAKLAKSLADDSSDVKDVQATTKSRVAKERIMFKPKPGVKKSAIMPTGLGNAGMGNTP